VKKNIMVGGTAIESSKARNHTTLASWSSHQLPINLFPNKNNRVKTQKIRTCHTTFFPFFHAIMSGGRQRLEDGTVIPILPPESRFMCIFGVGWFLWNVLVVTCAWTTGVWLNGYCHGDANDLWELFILAQFFTIMIDAVLGFFGMIGILFLISTGIVMLVEWAVCVMLNRYTIGPLVVRRTHERTEDEGRAGIRSLSREGKEN